jgi:hypothetical protein
MDKKPGCFWLRLSAFLAGSLLLAVRILSLRDIFGPVVYGDEFIYWNNMRVLFTSEGWVNSGYPPLYSFLMGAGSLWPDAYRGVLLLNVLLGLALPVVAWRFSRKLSSGCRLLVVVLFSILPFLLVYPRIMMSENLFVPLLVLTMLAMYGIFQGRPILAAIITGLILFFACMTRYPGVFFVLGAAMAISATWLWWGRYWKAGTMKLMGTGTWWAVILITGGLPCLGIILWLIFGIPNSWEIWQTASNIYRQEIQLTPKLFSMWLMFYLSYCLLAILPFLPPLLHAGWKIITSRRARPADLCLLLFGFFSTGIVMVVATRHSAMVEYNHPEPSHIMGRYLVFLPVMVMIGLLASGYFGERFDRKSRKEYGVIWIASALLGIIAYGTVIGGWFFKITPWFVMAHTGLDAYAYKVSPWILAGAVLIALLVMVPNRTVYFLALVVFTGIAAFSGRAAFYNNADGPEAFTQIVEEALQTYPDGLVGYISNSWFKDDHADYYLRFKGIDMSRIRIGEGFENQHVTAVIRSESRPSPEDQPLYTAKDGQAFYLEFRENPVSAAQD